MPIQIENNRLVFRYDAETLWIEPWGRDSLRVRATHNATMHRDDWALLEPAPAAPGDVELNQYDLSAAADQAARTLSLSAGVGSATGLAGRVAAHQAIRDGLLEIFRQAGMEAATPRGGSYLFVNLPRLEVSPEQFIALLRIQAGVTVTPGTEFGPQFASWFRINFSQDHEKAMDAAARIVRLAGRYRPEK